MSLDPVDQPFKLGCHMVAGYWRYLMPAGLEELKYPSEGRSTCMSCPKIVMEGYRKDYRCCTYFPRVPNFALGLILLQNQAGAEVVRRLIEEGYILPEGMIATPQKWALYFVEAEEDRYGKTDQVLCPFLNESNGFCKIYQYRNSVCSTYFCMKDGGAPGEQFWEELQVLGSQGELALGQWIMEQAGIEPAGYFKLLDGMDPARAGKKQNHAWTVTARKKLWGAWFGKEEDFLIKAAGLLKENRSSLWDLINSRNIEEAGDFERKSLVCVPKKHRKAARKEMCPGDGGQTVAPWKIWNGVLSRYQKLRTAPGGLLWLSPKARVRNVTGVALQIPFPDCSHILSLYGSMKDAVSGEGEEKEREYLDLQTFQALTLFSTPVLVDYQLLQRVHTLTNSDPLEFVSNWHHKKILIPYRAGSQEDF